MDVLKAFDYIYVERDTRGKYVISIFDKKRIGYSVYL